MSCCLACESRVQFFKAPYSARMNSTKACFSSWVNFNCWRIQVTHVSRKSLACHGRGLNPPSRVQFFNAPCSYCALVIFPVLGQTMRALPDFLHFHGVNVPSACFIVATPVLGQT